MSPLFATALFLADAGSDTPAPPQGPNIFWFLPILLIMMFVMGGPRRRADKEHKLKLAALRTGDEVVACGGIHGLVTNVNDRLVTLKIADNVKIRVEKASVMTVLKKSDEPEPEPAVAVTDAPVKEVN